MSALPQRGKAALLVLPHHVAQVARIARKAPMPIPVGQDLRAVLGRDQRQARAHGPPGLRPPISLLPLRAVPQVGPRTALLLDRSPISLAQLAEPPQGLAVAHVLAQEARVFPSRPLETQ